MNEDEILDRPFLEKQKKNKFNIVFYIASVFLILRFVFYYMHWPYTNILLITSGSLYVLFSLLRLFFLEGNSLFQNYSYVFFILVIPGFIMDHLYLPGAKTLLNISASIPLIFMIHFMIKRRKLKS